MAYRIAGIDVHKRMLAVVIADVAVEGEYQFDRRMVGTSPDQLRALAEWFIEREVEEVVMESTAQYWRPVWDALERYWQPRRRAREGAGPVSGALHLAQARSNQGARGRKKDFPDAERLVRRLVAQELILSFVPGLCVSETDNQPTIHALKDTALGLDRRIRGLIEEATHLAITIGRSAAVIDACALIVAWTRPHPGRQSLR